MADHQFQLVGGDPALDFVNTIHDWTVPEPRDYVPTYADAVRFAEVAGIVTAGEAKRLVGVSAGSELRRLRELRERLERMLRAAVAGRSPTADDLEALSREAADAARTAVLRNERGRLTRTIDAQAAGVATVRWRLVEATVALLTSERLGRLSACPSCGWFFLDTTKNGSRRWCSMAMCGSAAKARSYYWRSKGGRGREGRPGERGKT